jgi:hypothetical protein
MVATLSPQLTERFGRGLHTSSQHRMVKLPLTFPIRCTGATERVARSEIPNAAEQEESE